MDPTIIIEIAELALGIVKGNVSGGAANAVDAATSLAAIAQKAIQAYEAQTGQPMDLTLLKPEAPLTPDVEPAS